MVISATIEKNLPKNKAITMKSQSSILSSTEAEFVTCNWKTPNIKKMSMSYSEKNNNIQKTEDDWERTRVGNTLRFKDE